MKKSLLISAALFLALTAAVYAAFPDAPAASQAAPVAAPVSAPFAAAVCCTPRTDAASGEVTMLEVEMTPIVQQAPAQKSDERFANYVLENAASGGQ